MRFVECNYCGGDHELAAIHTRDNGTITLCSYCYNSRDFDQVELVTGTQLRELIEDRAAFFEMGKEDRDEVYRYDGDFWDGTEEWPAHPLETALFMGAGFVIE